MKYTLKSTNIEMTEAIKNHVDKRVNALDKYFNRVIQARLEIGMPSMHHHKGDIFLAEANISVPGDMIRIVVRHEDLYVAIDQLTRKMKRALIKFKDKYH